MKLGLAEYFNYLSSGENSRCVAEGEAVFDAGHIILCGRMTADMNEGDINIFALCLQSSALSCEPHEIKGVLRKDKNINIYIKQMNCSCKAGNSGKCKHISAVLIFCTRRNVEDLDLLSKTDIKCMWKARKTEAQERYKAVPVRDMPCLLNKFVQTPNLQCTDDEILNKFINALPNSAIALHRKGRRDYVENTVVFRINENLEKFILNNACQSVTMLEVAAFEVNFHNSCCREKFTTHFEESDTQKIFFYNQCSKEWFQERKYRITGSRIYEIFTYNQNNWRDKAMRYFYPKGFYNKFTKHGIKYEREARLQFAKKINKNVVEIGMVVSHSNIWLGYSADGVILEENEPIALLEIKCLYSGSTLTITDAIKSATYLEITEDEIKLKKKHKYYGQIQLGMAILNLPKCYFVLYASFDKSLEILEINFDYEFTKIMLQKVKFNYFRNMIPYICCM